MATDYLLDIEGIKGESKDSKFPGTIEVSSFSWGVSNAGTMSAGTGGGAGKASFQDIHFTTAVAKQAPKLMLACASGQHIAKALLHVREQGGEQQEYYTIKLTDVLVSSYQSGGHEGASKPMDQFSLNFTKVEFEYKPQDEKGKVGAPEKAGWDQKTVKKV